MYVWIDKVAPNFISDYLIQQLTTAITDYLYDNQQSTVGSCTTISYSYGGTGTLTVLFDMTDRPTPRPGLSCTTLGTTHVPPVASVCSGTNVLLYDRMSQTVSHGGVSGSAWRLGYDFVAYQCSALVSPNRQYMLAMQGDGNLVLYDLSQNTAIWASNTYESGVAGQYYYLGWTPVTQTTSRLVLWRARPGLSYSDVIRQSAKFDNSGAWLTMQDDGNLVVYSDSGNAVWARSWGNCQWCVTGCGGC